MKNKDEFINQIKKIMEKDKISIKKISDNTNIKYSTLQGYIKKGIEPSYTNTVKLCNYLDIELMENKEKYAKVDVDNIFDVIDKLPIEDKYKILKKLLSEKG